jgi:xanthine dehydrogenase accessory factor
MKPETPSIISAGDHLALFNTALHWMAQGHKVAIATVMQTWGSAPRPVGSHLVISDDGLFEGSVSGGCVEGAVILEAQACLQTTSSRTLSYGIADTQAWEVGLACGGKITILLQPIAEGFFSPALLQSVTTANKAGETISVTLNSATGHAGVNIEAAQPDFLKISYAPAMRMAIIGAVHIAQQLAPMAKTLGFDVLVIDPREMFAAAARMENISVSQDWPDDALALWKPDASSAIITLTHDPKLDDPALITALRSPAFYIGALGSRKTHASRVERLAAKGFSPADIARIHGPAGLSIGAKSPAEIAVSILAEMTHVRRSASHAQTS